MYLSSLLVIICLVTFWQMEEKNGARSLSDEIEVIVN
jgi:hypothetical protein